MLLTQRLTLLNNKMANVVVLLGSFLSVVCFSPCFARKSVMTGGISYMKNSDIKNTVEINRGLGIFLKKENEGLASTPNVFYKSICGTLQASSQVVQGVLYRVAVEIVPVDTKDFVTPDFGGQDVTSDDCILKAWAKPSETKFGCFTIWSRPWLEEEKERFIVDKEDSNDYKSCLAVNSY